MRGLRSQVDYTLHKEALAMLEMPEQQINCAGRDTATQRIHLEENKRKEKATMTP